MTYVHDVPGRLRIKNEALKANPVLSAAVQSQLEGLHGVEKITVNPMTGSILIHYDPSGLSSREIFKAARKVTNLKRTVAKQVSELSQARVALGKALFGWAVGKALEGSGLSFLSVLI